MEGELATAVDAIVKRRWDLRDGQVIPESEDTTLGNTGMHLSASTLLEGTLRFGAISALQEPNAPESDSAVQIMDSVRGECLVWLVVVGEGK